MLVIGYQLLEEIFSVLMWKLLLKRGGWCGVENIIKKFKF